MSARNAATVEDDLRQRIDDMESAVERAKDEADEAWARMKQAETRANSLESNRAAVNVHEVERIRTALALADVEPYAAVFRVEAQAHVRALLDAFDSLWRKP